MVSFIWAIILWSIVFILVPVERIKQIWPVAIVSFVWLFVLDYIFVMLGYYNFINVVWAVGGIPLIYIVGGSAGGLLMMNWLPRRSLYKVFVVLFFSGLLSVSAYVFELLGAFTLGKGYNHLINYIFNTAGLSLLVWLSLEFVNEEIIYSGNKTRLFSK